MAGSLMIRGSSALSSPNARIATGTPNVSTKHVKVIAQMMERLQKSINGRRQID
jgi:hypothetical protein